MTTLIRCTLPVLFIFSGLGLFAQKETLRYMINSETTMESLVQIKMDLMEHGAMFNMYDLEFTEEGKVSKISIKVDFGDGFKGTASRDDFSGLNHILIIRDYTPGKDSICIGDCPEYMQVTEGNLE